MKIGVLNELLSNISCKCEMSSDTVSNPAKGESISVKWDIVRNMALKVEFTFDK